MMHLFKVRLDQGQAVVAAESISQVLAIIKESMYFEDDFVDDNFVHWDDKYILKEIKEIPGYEVEGKLDVISYYKDV